MKTPRLPVWLRAEPSDRRGRLWLALVVLVGGLLALLVWLAGRYEISQVQEKLERDAAEAVGDVRSALTRNVQALQSLYAGSPTPGSWSVNASSMLHEHREWLRLEWRDPALVAIAAVDSPFRPPVFERMSRSEAKAEVAQACEAARRYNGPAYSRSYFVPQADGLGLEVMEMCMPLATSGRHSGFVVATYSLQSMLAELVGRVYTRSQEVSFVEPDGTRLALHGVARRGGRVFTGQSLLDLPGNTLVLRVDGWRAAPDLFPNLLTALVTAMSIALVSVLVLLGKDMRRRQKAEFDLANALAFRKAMEDSLVTGLRARDLEGRTTYVNPAFCEMVGFAADELLGRGAPAPYWPPELADEYQQRQAIRLGTHPAAAREGFESVFMRKDGSRFPVLIFEAPLVNVLGRQTGWMSALLDISEQRRIEDLSRASQDRLQATARLATVGEMASLLSHELNQPLAAIASYATGSLNLLNGESGLPGLNGRADRSDLQLALGRIAEQAERAGKVIRSVHDFVRRRDQAREPVAAQGLLNDIMPLVQLQARKLQVRVVVDIEAGLPEVLCDRVMVEQVLLNLARNAMQAMDQPAIRDRLLTFRVRRAASAEGNRWLEFSVADVGAGIPDAVARQLFTPFYTTKAEGMGLGLSLCRTVVEQHGGYMDHFANRPAGTVFRFTLPAATNRPTAGASIE